MVNPTPASTKSSSKKPRHCVVYDEKMKSFSLEDNKHLRSLFLVSVDQSTRASRYWKNFQLLKILNIKDRRLRKLPRCFRTLIGLKCLIVHGDSLLMIPRWLDHLKKLEVIDFGWRSVEFPNVELKMESLRYFKGNFFDGPISIRNWINIETLRKVRADDWMRCSSKLTATCSIRELDVCLLDMEDSDKCCKFRESFRKMENLVKLHIIVDFLPRVDTTLCIPNFCSRLTKLKLSGPMSNGPMASKFPPNLSHLTMEWTMLNEDPMQELGKLPNLSYLKLKHDFYMGEMMKVLHDGFPSLKVLVLVGMYELKSIEIEEGGMSHLKHLRIQGCPKLKTHNLPEHIIISAM